MVWMISCSRKLMSKMFEAVGMELSMQGAAAHAEFLGRFGAISVGLFQGANDQGFLGILHDQAAAIGRRGCCFLRAGNGGHAPANLWRQIPRGDFLRSPKNH